MGTKHRVSERDNTILTLSFLEDFVKHHLHHLRFSYNFTARTIAEYLCNGMQT